MVYPVSRRRKKHITKQNLREVKKRFKLFEQSCEDTKDLCDIPKILASDDEKETS